MARMDFALFVKFQLYGLPGAAALIGVNNLLELMGEREAGVKREMKRKQPMLGLAVI
jgi:hypothetical protein